MDSSATEEVLNEDIPAGEADSHAALLDMGDTADGLFTRKRRARPTGRQKRVRKNLTKEDISNPEGFIHVFHAEGSPGTGLDPRWLILLNAVGVTNEQLQNHDTAQFIYSFVKEKGGIEIAVKDMKEDSPSPAMSFSQLPSGEQTETKNSSLQSIESLISSPPLPPLDTPLDTPQDTPLDTPQDTPQEPSSSPGPAVPPAPLPPNLAHKPTLVSPFEGDSHNELLTRIRQGVTLKKADNTNKVRDISTAAKDELFKNIREGTVLRPVAKREWKRRTRRVLSGVAAALVRALQERNVFIRLSDEDTDEDEDEETYSEWMQ